MLPALDAPLCDAPAMGYCVALSSVPLGTPSTFKPVWGWTSCWAKRWKVLGREEGLDVKPPNMMTNVHDKRAAERIA